MPVIKLIVIAFWMVFGLPIAIILGAAMFFVTLDDCIRAVWRTKGSNGK